MRSERGILHRAAAFGLVALVAVAGFAGCSSVEPTETWTAETGTLTGTVRSSTGGTLQEIEVWIWTEPELGGDSVWYQTTTGPGGQYEFEEVVMTTSHSYSETYWMYVNRTPESSTSINADYGTYRATVTIHKSETNTADIVIEFVDTPGDPDSYMED